MWHFKLRAVVNGRIWNCNQYSENWERRNERLNVSSVALKLNCHRWQSVPSSASQFICTHRQCRLKDSDFSALSILVIARFLKTHRDLGDCIWPGCSVTRWCFWSPVPVPECTSALAGISCLTCDCLTWHVALCVPVLRSRQIILPELKCFWD